MTKTILIALDINKIPYVTNPEVILTLGTQKIWYTTSTKAITVPKRIKLADSLLNSFIKKFFKKSTKRDIFTFNYFTKHAKKYLKKNNYDQVIFENNQLKNKILPNLTNEHQYVAKNSLA
ncbi:hypothetical protein [Companilactobacillus halodurans]|uniref:Uncharacterized protein n=1 Tax=Companilactobacillus halodurans TaxID=2584183 RepID=A0A5P0ZWS5_9LACO|nr:hypothetical protein [Companilactobacillus halodurans]MQS75409.1 hypothetical protein [Companilactobacillus halodurans]MQS97355.1 hypothetical protein [Companilactobacillus halodurans]